MSALSGGLALASTVLSPVLVLWLLAAILVTQVVIELGGHERHTSPAPV